MGNKTKIEGDNNMHELDNIRQKEFSKFENAIILLSSFFLSICITITVMFMNRTTFDFNIHTKLHTICALLPFLISIGSIVSSYYFSIKAIEKNIEIEQEKGEKLNEKITIEFENLRNHIETMNLSALLFFILGLFCFLGYITHYIFR